MTITPDDRLVFATMTGYGYITSWRLDGNALSVAKDPASPKVPGDGTFRGLGGIVGAAPNDIWMTPDGAYLSAPAQDSILLMRMTWKGWTRTLRWKASFPAVLVMYLLAQMRAASRASLESCSYSSETRWAQKGKSSTEARFRPRSKILI